MKHLGKKKHLGHEGKKISNTWGTWGGENFFSEKTLGIENVTPKSFNAVGRSGGDLGNVVGRGGKKILPPSAEHLGVKKTRWTRMV